MLHPSKMAFYDYHDDDDYDYYDDDDDDDDDYDYYYYDDYDYYDDDEDYANNKTPNNFRFLANPQQLHSLYLLSLLCKNTHENTINIT